MLATGAARVLAIALLGAAACGHHDGAEPPDGGSTGFVGTFACTSTEVLTIAVPPGVAPQTTADESTIEIADAGADRIAMTANSAAGLGCLLTFGTSGDAATLAAATSCTGGGFTLSFTSGTAVLSGSVLTVATDFTFQGAVSTDAGVVQESGSGTLASSCDST